MMAEDRVPNALLVVGMLGLGALPYAAMLAQALTCDAPVDGRPCLDCPSCRLAAADSHPDLFVLAPDGSQVRIDAVRDAVAWAAYRPQRGRRRVVRLDGADRMGMEAAVAALKSVEEPGPAVHWVLSADAPGRISAPLRSRCVEVALRPVARTDMERWLVARGFDPERVAMATERAAGLPGMALDWMREQAGEPPGEQAGTQADEAEALLRAVRGLLREHLRAGAATADQARRALLEWTRLDEGRRRGTAPRLVADAARDLLGRLSS